MLQALLGTDTTSPSPASLSCHAWQDTYHSRRHAWDWYSTAWPQSPSVPHPGQVLQCLEPSEMLRGPRQAPCAPGHTQPCRGGEGK